MHNNTLNTVLARLLRITTPKRHQKDISAHIVFQDNIVCVAEFIHIQHQRRLHKLHIFDWPFADFGCLSPATLTAAAHYLEEQLQHIIRLLEMSETGFLKLEKEVTENALAERETSAIHLSFYHLKLHAHLHYASWQTLKRTLFQISPQLQLRTEKISPLKPGRPDDLLNLFVHLTIPTVQ